jgi:hypothetical protein
MAIIATEDSAFIDQLSQRLSEGQGWKVQKEADDDLSDLIVETQDGKRMFIEFKQAGTYGELPLSTVLSLNKQKKRLSGKDALCLVSFSKIPTILKETLAEMGILAIEKPSVEDAAGKIEQAMMAVA